MKARAIFLLLIVAAATLRAQEKPDPAREKMVERLNGIMLTAVHMTEAKMTDVAEFFEKKALVIEHMDPGDGRVALKVAVKDDGAGRLAAARVNYATGEIPLSEALRYAAEETGSKLVVDGEGVAFVPLDGYKGGVPPSLPPSLLSPRAQEEGRKQMQAKLDQIVIPKISFRQAKLRDALEFLHRKAFELDTSASAKGAIWGVSIVLIQYPAPENDNTPAPGDTQISLEAADMSLDAALKEIARLSGMKMTVEPYAVVFRPDTQQQK